MNASRALRVVTAPQRTVEGVRAVLPNAVRGGADVVEVRIDRLPPSEVLRLGQLFPSVVPLIATYRSRTEGGEGADDPGRRGPILAEAGSLPFAYLDLEADRDRPPDLTHEPEVDPAQYIVSRHLDTIDLWEDARSLLTTTVPRTAWKKIVVPASVGELLDRILPGLPGPGTQRFTVHTTGPSGALLRIWADQLGMAAVYCAPPSDTDSARAVPPVEPTQIPVDRLHIDRMAPEGPFFGLLGRPTSHSLSPRIHTRWMHASHHRGVYVAIDVLSEAELSLVVRALVRRGFRGFNVTSPWKEAALRTADSASPSAKSTGGANTLSEVGDAVHADNTDRHAVKRRLEELRHEGTWSDDKLTVVGTGGAARAALDAARELGAERWVVGRNPAATAELEREFGAKVVDLARPPRTSVVLHATTVGREGHPGLGVDIRGLLGPGRHLVDFVYAPKYPTLRELSESAGASYEDGERLLLYQAVESYRIWWGESPPDQDGIDR
jgi:shikimate dehydrogenase